MPWGQTDSPPCPQSDCPWGGAETLARLPLLSPTKPPHRGCSQYPRIASSDGDGPGAVSGGGQAVGALAGEVEVPPVKGAVPGSGPGEAAGRGAPVPGSRSSQGHGRRRLGGRLSCHGEVTLLSKRPCGTPHAPPGTPGPTSERQVRAGKAGCGGAVPPAVTPGVPAALGQAHGREVAAAGAVLALPRAVAAPQQAFACGTGTRFVSTGEHRASRQLGARWWGQHDGATAPHHQPLPSVQWGPLQPWQQARTVRFHTTGRVSGGLRGGGSPGIRGGPGGTQHGDGCPLLPPTPASPLCCVPRFPPSTYL